MSSQPQPAQEKTWAEITREELSRILRDSTIPQIIDNGIDGCLPDGPGMLFANLIADEEFEEDAKEFEGHVHRITELASGLPEDSRAGVEEAIEQIDQLFLTRAHEGAEKMADILFRFYLRHHLGLDV